MCGKCMDLAVLACPVWSHTLRKTLFLWPGPAPMGEQESQLWFQAAPVARTSPLLGASRQVWLNVQEATMERAGWPQPLCAVCPSLEMCVPSAPNPTLFVCCSGSWGWESQGCSGFCF